MNNWNANTVAELRQVAQYLIRQGKLTGKTAREVAFMNKDALMSMLAIYETDKGHIDLSTILVAALITSDETSSPEPAKSEPAKSEPAKPEPAKPEPAKSEPATQGNDNLASVLASALKDYIKPGLDVEKVRDIVKDELKNFNITERMTERMNELDKYITQRAAVLEKELTEKLAKLAPIKVQSFDGKVIEVGIQHFKFQPVLKLAAARHNIWLTGPAGSGKTFLAESVARALSLNFEALSVGLQTSKSDLFGYTDAHGNYVETAFYRCYKNGGVFLLDEIDNGNANVLAMINAATANGSCGFPMGMVPKHKDFVFIAAANTYGLGASAVYVGRNQIDGATRDRFVFIEFPYDEKLEDCLTTNKEWLARVRRIRRAIDQLREKVIASPRASILGSQALSMGFTANECLDMYIFRGVSNDVKEKVLSKAL